MVLIQIKSQEPFPKRVPSVRNSEDPSFFKYTEQWVGDGPAERKAWAKQRDREGMDSFKKSNGNWQTWNTRGNVRMK